MCGFIHIVSPESSTRCGRIPNTGGNFRRLEPVVAVTGEADSYNGWGLRSENLHISKAGLPSTQQFRPLLIQSSKLKCLNSFFTSKKLVSLWDKFSEHMGCLLGCFPNEINLSWALQPFFSIGEQSLKWVLALFSIKSNGHSIRFGNRCIDCGNLVPNADYFNSPINHFSSFTLIFNIQNSL